MSMLEPSGEVTTTERLGIFDLSPRQWATFGGGLVVMVAELRFGSSEIDKAIGFLGSVAAGSPFAEKLYHLDQERYQAEAAQPSADPLD